MGARDSHPDRWRWVLLTLMLSMLACAWAGCGTPQQRYKTLSFFFDGVPDPNAPPRQPGKERIFGGEGGGTPTAEQMVSHHKPFVEDKCSACHNNLNVLIDSSAMDASRCITCHKNVPRQYKVMHGPVDAGACLWCHSPHESPQPALLREPAPKLCLQCHEPNQLPAKVPEHKTVRQSCLDCHMAHGGPNPGLLKASAASGPTTGGVQ